MAATVGFSLNVFTEFVEFNDNFLYEMLFKPVTKAMITDTGNRKNLYIDPQFMLQ